MFLKNFSIKADNISACVKINRNGHVITVDNHNGCGKKENVICSCKFRTQQHK